MHSHPHCIQLLYTHALMLMATQIDIIQKLNVYPRFQNHDQKKLITLSNLDRQCPLLMYLVFFYKKTTSRDFDSVFSDLKLGLEETLSVWYPAAGRLGLDGGGCKINLRCNGGGAVMVEAVATGVKLSELGDLNQYNELYETLVYKPSFDGDFSVMPLVVAQVTRFACGGYSIGIGTSHSLFDGISAYEFLHTWALNSHSTRNKLNGNKKDLLVIKPVHDRGNLLFNRDVNRSWDAIRVTKAAAIYHLYQLIEQAMMDHQGQNRNFELPDSGFVIKTFELNGEAIQSIKNKSPQGFSCSSFEFLAAHLWKARTRALKLRRDAMVCLQFAVDIRKRTEPPLPEGFSGNAYVLASVASTARELLEELTNESIVNKIREAKKSIDQDYINSYMEALGGGDQRNDGNLPPIKELTLISDWTKMSFHSVGFGNDGEPADYVAPLCPPVPHVAYFMKNPKDAKGVIVRIGLDPRDVTDFTNHFLGY